MGGELRQNLGRSRDAGAFEECIVVVEVKVRWEGKAGHLMALGIVCL